MNVVKIACRTMILAAAFAVACSSSSGDSENGDAPQAPVGPVSEVEGVPIPENAVHRETDASGTALYDVEAVNFSDIVDYYEDQMPSRNDWQDWLWCDGTNLIGVSLPPPAIERDYYKDGSPEMLHVVLNQGEGTMHEIAISTSQDGPCEA